MSVFLEYKFILLLFIKFHFLNVSYLISNPTKEIWINLEFSFKIYHFFNF